MELIDVRFVKGLRYGYVTGAMDQIPDVLSEFGVDIRGKDLMIGIDFTRFRVLAYSGDGDIIVDRIFTIHNNVRL